MFTPLYKIYFKAESAKTETEIMNAVHASGARVYKGDDGFKAGYFPSSLAFWRGRGELKIKCTAGNEGKIICHCEAIPRLFNFDLSQIIFLILLAFISYFILKNSFSIYTILTLAVGWIFIVLSASYILIIILTAATIICFLNFSVHTVAALLIAWLFLLLILHLTFRYHASQLREIFLNTLRQ